MIAITEQRTKGSAVRGTLEFLRETHGDSAVAAALDPLTPEERTQIEEAELTDELSYTLLLRIWEASNAHLSDIDPDWIERSGAHSIRSSGVQLYGGIVRKASPHEFLSQRVSLFRLYYHPGDMQVVERGSSSAMLRLLGFDPITPLFCRRQTGGLREVVAMAGGTDIRCSHVRCALEGDAFCEWALQWTPGTEGGG
jgi:hypothetical protein